MAKDKCAIGLSDEIETEIKIASLIWRPLADIAKRDLLIPVYRNGARQDLLFTAQVSSTDSQQDIYERGIAFTTAE